MFAAPVVVSVLNLAQDRDSSSILLGLSPGASSVLTCASYIFLRKIALEPTCKSDQSMNAGSRGNMQGKNKNTWRFAPWGGGVRETV
jgi:hypothetical protein